MFSQAMLSFASSFQPNCFGESSQNQCRLEKTHYEADKASLPVKISC